MRTVLTILILLPIVLSCSKNKEVVNQCYCSEEIKELYSEDVNLILFREIYSNPDHPDRNNAVLNENKASLLLNAIQSTYDLNSHNSDSIFNTYNIHVFPMLSMRNISLEVNPESDEIINLIAGEPTGNPVLDDLLSTYSFNEVTTSFFYPDFTWITISSEESWNLIPICEELEKFDFIHIAEQGGGAVGGGNDLNIEINGNDILLDFSIGWGDCPSGCIYEKHWIYKTTTLCETPKLISIYSD